MDVNAKIFVAGHRGLVGSAILRKLKGAGYQNLITATRTQCDLLNPRDVELLFTAEQPDYVFLAAAKVGGILANRDQPADFIFQNLQIQSHVIDAAYRHGVKKLLFLGSSCIYPKFAKQPITEDQLLAGHLEPTNDAYAIAKIAGIKMCQAYRAQHGFQAISLMPTNLYGPNDNFDLQSSHVLPAMIVKFHNAVTQGGQVELWGDGSAMREFLHVDDLADASLFCMLNYDSPEIVNVGTGTDVTIKELAETVADITGYDSEILWDTSKPNGTPRKLLDVSKLRSLGWSARIPLETGTRSTYDWYKTCIAQGAELALT